MVLEQRRRTWPILLILIALTGLPVGLGSFTAEGNKSPSSAPIAIEAGLLNDPKYGYSFAVPTSWELDSKSVSGNLSLVQETLGSHFSLQVKDNASDVETEFKGLKMAVPFLGGKWSQVGERWTKVGKLRAGELESTRTRDDGTTWHEWNLVWVKKSQAYLLWLSIPDAQVEQGRTSLNQVLDSFQWVKK